MPKPAFIVEGFMEKRIIQKLCPGTKVVRLNINGRDVAIEAIAKRIESHFRIFSNRYGAVLDS